MERLRDAREAELEYIKSQNSLEIERQQELTKIEVHKFESMVTVISPQVLAEMARTGPEMQAKLLGSLGIQSTLITDGTSPINLFNTAQGLMGGAASGKQ